MPHTALVGFATDLLHNAPQDAGKPSPTKRSLMLDERMGSDQVSSRAGAGPRPNVGHRAGVGAAARCLLGHPTQTARFVARHDLRSRGGEALDAIP